MPARAQSCKNTLPKSKQNAAPRVCYGTYQIDEESVTCLRLSARCVKENQKTRDGIHMALGRPVYASETADGTTARTVALGSAVHGELAQMYPHFWPGLAGGKS